MSFVKEKADSYLSMEKDVYGKVRDRYPEYLLSEHKIISQKHRLIKQEIDEAKWKERVEALKKKSEVDEAIQIAPPVTKDAMIDAARNLSNCLSSYVSRFLEDKCDIYLITSKGTVIGAIEVRENAICQAKAAYNRQLSKETQQYVVKWAKKNNFAILTQDITAHKVEAA